jgi:flagellar basal-body rod protein FlgG
VDEQGFITQDGQIVARVGVVDFADYNYLEKYGENLYNLVDGGTIQASTAKVNQGVLEASNVNIVNEMVDLITITRAYEANQKIIQTIDSTLDKAVNQVGRVG